MFRFIKDLPVLLAVMVAVMVFAVNAKADEFFLAADGVSVEKRVGSLEKRVADLEKKLAVPNTAARGPVNPIAPTKIKFQVCVNGVCRNGECENINQVPIGAKILNPEALGVSVSTAVPCPTGPCGDNCQCAGAMASMSTSMSTSSGGGRTGWYPGKNLGRGKRAASGCATCGN